ncbi:hypothetical protein MMSR116_24860 [Methylobacterium mesophilicum SR1.6/6]|uniref:Twin-arginine translocation signal domain-containing protein n=1 Tax=Methylobacterium mesophilicum SR1.6/6 TaxID=908290 RepID=A0A6B9FV19_9HYPH|nr:hypothetical protein [Methylobacterium mesophilicum]QGY04775.1 hypothetical protein MMSR116_24860 [Methylobacterium mesophilicum SR1.6/6]
MSAPANRCGFLRGLALASATAGTGAFALPTTAAQQSHPDADLIAAGVEADRLDAAFKAACEARTAAGRAARRDHGLVPLALVLNAEEKRLFRHWWFGMPGDPPYPRVRPQSAPDGSWRNPDLAWSGRGLRVVIERAVGRLGPAGRTPHLLRRWRQLLPLADAHDRRVEEAHARYRIVELGAAEREAETAWRAARDRMRLLTATTSEGLAVHVGMFEAMYRENIPEHYLPLLLSAANVSGVSLNLREMGHSA